MYLLSDNAWGDFPTWVQAGCALITLMLVIMGLLQNRRIQELTDIVKELGKQTTELKAQSELLGKRYGLERKLSIRSKIPIFERENFYASEYNTHFLTLRNVGLNATDVHISKLDYERPIAEFDISNQGNIFSGYSLGMYIRTTIDWLEESDLSFSFTLVFMDGVGNKFSQFLKCVRGIITLELAMDIE